MDSAYGVVVEGVGIATGSGILLLAILFAPGISDIVAYIGRYRRRSGPREDAVSAIHLATENAALRELLAGRMPKDSYRALIRDLACEQRPDARLPRKRRPGM